MEAPISSETSVLTRVTQCNTPENVILKLLLRLLAGHDLPPKSFFWYSFMLVVVQTLGQWWDWKHQVQTDRQTNKQTNSEALSPQANYTDWATSTSWRNLVPTFVDRGVSRSQPGGSPTVVNLSFLDPDGSGTQNYIQLPYGESNPRPSGLYHCSSIIYIKINAITVLVILKNSCYTLNSNEIYIFHIFATCCSST
jgi:hypothetical protein